MSEQLRVANDDRLANVAYFFFRNGLEHNLRSDSRGITHGDTDARSRAATRIRRILRQFIHRSKRETQEQTPLPACAPGETKIRRLQSLLLLQLGLVPRVPGKLGLRP